jgi:hypothetical protein
MLKIWLTWLQPSLGVLGTALVLSNPFYAYAAPKPAAVRITPKPTQFSPWSIAKSTGTRIDRELASGIAATPDLAVRQLAIDSMVTPGLPQAHPTIKIRQVKPTPVASIASPAARVSLLSSKSIKPTKLQQVKSSVAAELARAIDPRAAISVPGIYVGNSNTPTAKKTTPTLKPVTQAVSSAIEIGAPTSLSAMMSAKPTADPFPVVRPEMMQKIQQAAVKTPAKSTTIAAARIATVKTPVKSAAQSAPHSLDPIATIPTGQPKAKVVNLKATAPHSLDPIASIPSGLQKLLGNNLNSQPTIARTPVAKAIAIKPNAVLALKQLVSPTATVPTSVSAASLRLATAQAYTSVPKFSIPGEPLLTAKAVKPTVNLQIVKREQPNLTTAVVGRKSNYVARLTPVAKQSWAVVNQRNNLGGLILGSQPLSTVTRVVSLSSTNALNASAAIGQPVSDLVDIN